MKKIKLITFILSCALLFCSCGASLGNISENFSNAETSVSSITFTANSGDKIKFSFRTEIESGNVDFVLYNSDGKEITEFDDAKALETYVVVDSDDTYKLAAEYENFIGKFSAKAITE